MQKKGQITFFIIIGMLILISITVIMYFSSEYKKISREAEFNNNMNKETVNYVEQCIIDTTLDGVFFNSLQGGYFNVPDPYLGDIFLSIPFYGVKGSYNVPTIEILESELELYIDKNIDTCLEDFEDFSLYGIDIKKDDIKSEVIIKESGNIDVTLYMDTSISGNFNSMIDEYHSKIGCDYYRYHNVAVSYIEHQKRNPNAILFSDLMSISKDNDMKATYIEDLNGNYKNIIFIFKDEDFKREPFGNYTYMFALEYDW